MEEFIFGTWATDELKLVHHRAEQSGLQHRHALSPRDPQPDRPVTLTIHAGPELRVEQVACYYTVDGSEPAGSRGVAHHGAVVAFRPAGVEWDSLVWGYVQQWECALPPQPLGTAVRYQIGAWAADAPEIFADWPAVKDVAEQASAAFFAGKPRPATPPGDPGRRHTFAYRVDRQGPPEWARQAVIYHVFVDRFYPGGGRGWLQTDDLRGFCGGTLWGVAEKTEYIAGLGATCIWLSPTFVSPSHHGYDATDLERVEPRLGGGDALHAVVEAAHRCGIRVLLDYPCNHLSNQHPFFVAAQSNPAGPYRDWFTFNESAVGYRSFFGVPTLPEINVSNPAVRRWLIDIARYWLREFDVDGYRLDYANGPGPDFWSDFWAACKQEKPDCFCFGEVVDAPHEQMRYVGRLDGCLDFHTGDALRRTFAHQSWTEGQLDRFLERHLGYFPADFLRPTFVDNHDMDRFLTIANGDKGALRRAAGVQMQLPGPPIIYYGTEVGLMQEGSTRQGLGLHVSRVPMAWGDEQDKELLDYYQKIIRERRSRTG